MRVGIGSAVIVLIIALVSLGFLLSDTINTHQELRAVSQEAAQVQQENQNLREQLNVVNKNNEALNARNSELEQQTLSLQKQIQQLQEQNNALEQQKQVLEKKVSDLEGQIITLQSTSSIDTTMPMKIPSALSLALFVPFLPIAIAATYVVTRQRAKGSTQTNQGTRLNNAERGNMVRLSDDEMKTIIKMRRGHNVG